MSRLKRRIRIISFIIFAFCLAMQVNASPGVTVRSVSMGNGHTLFLMSDGTVRACGDNFYGQLGNGTYTNSTVPVKVSNLANVVQVAAGADFSFALKSDGTVWGWGDNNNGILRNGKDSCWYENHGKDTGDNDQFVSEKVPILINDLKKISSIAAGSDFAMASNKDSIYVWNRINRFVSPNSNKSAKVLFAGESEDDQQQCAFLNNAGYLYAWGNNKYLSLGLSDTGIINTPTNVNDFKNIANVFMTRYCTKKFVLLKDGSLYTWGHYQILGTKVDNSLKTTTYRALLPQKVKNVSNVKDIAFLNSFFYVLNKNGTVSRYNQSFTSKPIQVKGLAKISKLYTGYDLILALDDKGNLFGLGNPEQSGCSTKVQKQLIPYKILIQ